MGGGSIYYQPAEEKKLEAGHVYTYRITLTAPSEVSLTDINGKPWEEGTGAVWKRNNKFV